MLFGHRTPIRLQANIDREPIAAVLVVPPGPLACSWAHRNDWSLLFPGALPTDQRDWWERRLEDPGDHLDRHMLRPLALQAAHAVYGVPWWVAHRLLTQAADDYLSFQAFTIRRGFDPSRESADRIVAACYAWRLSGFEKETEATMWWAQLTTPPADMMADMPVTVPAASVGA